MWFGATNDTGHAQRYYLTVARLTFAEWRSAFKTLLANVRLRSLPRKRLSGYAENLPQFHRKTQVLIAVDT